MGIVYRSAGVSNSQITTKQVPTATETDATRDEKSWGKTETSLALGDTCLGLHSITYVSVVRNFSVL